jgi:hypothetical protein
MTMGRLEMKLPDPSDLLSLDREVARAHAAWTKWKLRLAADPEAHAGEVPLDRFRHVAGQSACAALGEGAAGVGDAPLRAGLRRWVYWLLQARIAQTLDVELAKATAERSAHVSVPKPHKTSWQEAWRGLLTSPTPVERSAWLEAAAERGPALASLARRREERRDEVRRRMGFDAADPLFGAPSSDLVAGAEALLDRTEDLAREVLAKARRRSEMTVDPPQAADAIAIAIARDAPEGWPARLAWPWLDETFGPFLGGLRIPALGLPDAVGASSFARGCGTLGAALRVAGASPSLPFALAREPEFVAMHRFACIFGALPATAPFQKRVLGNVARVADAQARVLTRTALLEARLEAARFLLASDRAPDRFEHLTHRLFGAPLPAALAGAWPAPCDDMRARLVGLLTAQPLATDLRERFDVDWFANPRAVIHVRAIASAPALEDPPSDLPAAGAALARAFETALG